MLQAANSHRTKILMVQMRTAVGVASMSGTSSMKRPTQTTKAVIFDMGGVIFPSPGSFFSSKLRQRLTAQLLKI